MGPDLQLPWSATEVDDKRFLRLLRNGLVMMLLLSVVVPFIPIKEITREQKEELPPQLARVILEKKELPPPPPKPKKKLEKKQPKKEKPKAKPKPRPRPKEKPKQELKVVDEVAKAKETAQISGVLAFQDDLMDMRESLDVDSLNNAAQSKGDSSAAKVERSVITGKAVKGSGGIAVSKLSRNTGGAALSGRETTRVVNADAVAVSNQRKAGAAKASGRSDESIRRIMDRNKSRIFSIYNRALRKDPALQGRFVFKMIIAPSGQIVSLVLISSELDNDVLNRKILSRVNLINFGAEKVLKTTVNYSFDFIPY